MPSPSIGRRAVLFFGIEQMLLSALLLYLAFDAYRSPAYGMGTSIFVLVLAGIGGATGLGLIWRAGRITWRADLKPLDDANE